MKSKERIARMIARGSSRRWSSTLQQRAGSNFVGEHGKARRHGKASDSIRDTGLRDMAMPRHAPAWIRRSPLCVGRKIAFVSDFLENESLRRIPARAGQSFRRSGVRAARSRPSDDQVSWRIRGHGVGKNCWPSSSQRSHSSDNRDFRRAVSISPIDPGRETSLAVNIEYRLVDVSTREEFARVRHADRCATRSRDFNTSRRNQIVLPFADDR